MIIKNFNELAISSARKKALLILESGLKAIQVDKIVQKAIVLKKNVLKIKEIEYDLEKFENIYIIGIGKCAGETAKELERILGNRITSGVIIDVIKASLKYIKSYKGTHPMSSQENIFASCDIIKIAKRATERDLVIAIISGGGSALLCYPNDLECVQGQELYRAYLNTSCDILELNIIRKHISELKGGGLAKMLYPAQVLGLIFSDIPGEHCELVASGPTYFDKSDLQDANRLIKKYKFPKLRLIETPKQEKYFEKIENICLMSNNNALKAMKEKALELNLKPIILGNNIYGKAEDIAMRISNIANKGEVILAGGESTVIVKKGKGGRNQHLALSSFFYLKKDQVVVSCCSDGIDNTDRAGAVADKLVLEKAKKLGLDYKEFLKNTDSYNFFKQTNDLIFTGAIKSNVSDLMISLIE